MTIYGGLLIERFAKKHPQSRKPLARFVALTAAAEWKNIVEVKATFAATDYAPETGTLIFDVGGNKYRLIADVDFEDLSINVQAVLTHAEYNKEKL